MCRLSKRNIIDKLAVAHKYDFVQGPRSDENSGCIVYSCRLVKFVNSFVLFSSRPIYLDYDVLVNTDDCNTRVRNIVSFLQLANTVVQRLGLKLSWTRSNLKAVNLLVDGVEEGGRPGYIYLGVVTAVIPSTNLSSWSARKLLPECADGHIGERL